MGAPVNVISSSLRPKNYLINSGFTIWQRFSAFATNGTVASVFYHADRWTFFSGVVSNYALSRQAHSNPLYANSRHAIRVQRNSGNASTGAYQLTQTLERVDSERLRGKTVTLSFSARRGANFSSAGNILRTEIITTVLNPDTNYVAGWTSPLTANFVENALTETMSRYTVTAVIPSNISNVAVNFRYTPVGTAGANDWFQIEDVQLEEGEAASEWELRGSFFASELILCQRYCYQITGTLFNDASAGVYSWVGFVNTDSNWRVSKQPFPTTMRAAPIGSFSNGNNTFYWHIPTAESLVLGSVGAVSAPVTTPDFFCLHGSRSNGTVRFMEIRLRQNEWIRFDAEL